MTVGLRDKAPVVDGKLDDWAGADWVDINKSGVAANFDSHSKPFNVTAAVAVAGDRLYVAFRTGDPRSAAQLGRDGDGPIPHRRRPRPDDRGRSGSGPPSREAGGRRRAPGGHARQEPDMGGPLSAGRAGDEGAGTRSVRRGAPSPSTRWIDVSDQVRLASSGGDYELSIPLETLGLKPEAGEAIRGDVGVLRGDGFQTLAAKLLEQQGHGPDQRRALRGDADAAFMGEVGIQITAGAPLDPFY